MSTLYQKPHPYLVSCKDLEGVHNLVSSVLVNSLACHEFDKLLKGDITGLVGVYIFPQLIKHRVISLERRGGYYNI